MPLADINLFNSCGLALFLVSARLGEAIFREIFASISSYVLRLNRTQSGV